MFINVEFTWKIENYRADKSYALFKVKGKAIKSLKVQDKSSQFLKSFVENAVEKVQVINKCIMLVIDRKKN